MPNSPPCPLPPAATADPAREAAVELLVSGGRPASRRLGLDPVVLVLVAGLLVVPAPADYEGGTADGAVESSLEGPSRVDVEGEGAEHGDTEDLVPGR